MFSAIFNFLKSFLFELAGAFIASLVHVWESDVIPFIKEFGMAALYRLSQRAGY